MPEKLWLGLKISEWIMVVAVLVGPIIAVLITRFNDNRREIKTRQLSILRSLLKTRQVRLDAEHVGALNLIELEFYGVDSIVHAYSSYISHLSSIPVEAAQDNFYRVRVDLFSALLHAIGNHLGYRFDKLDLDRRSYSPIAWVDEQERARKNAALLTELLEGKRSLPVFNLIVAQNQFPPPPNP
jgi:hypothetical protein